jgi:hypothetical protein
MSHHTLRRRGARQPSREVDRNGIAVVSPAIAAPRQDRPGERLVVGGRRMRFEAQRRGTIEIVALVQQPHSRLPTQAGERDRRVMQNGAAAHQQIRPSRVGGRNRPIKVDDQPQRVLAHHPPPRLGVVDGGGTARQRHPRPNRHSIRNHHGRLPQASTTRMITVSSKCWSPPGSNVPAGGQQPTGTQPIREDRNANFPDSLSRQYWGLQQLRGDGTVIAGLGPSPLATKPPRSHNV